MKKYHIIGVMSGTSLDGVDLAEVYFYLIDGKWSFRILNAETVPYSDFWVKKLKNAINLDKNSLDLLNIEYTKLLSSLIVNFIAKHKIKKIDAVCSHGHTVIHRPDLKYTLQIGNLPEIASLIKQNVVCDFRTQDVKFGGQGAPLVPIGDRLLFPEFEYCINLGGFSNLSFELNGERIAYDICPVNTVLNHYANKLGFEYDDEGSLACTGKLNKDLLDELDAIDYYRESYPKSLGFEFVKDVIFPMIDKYQLPEVDVLCTFGFHVVRQICANLKNDNAKVLITGGGANNKFIIFNILGNMMRLRMEVPTKDILDFKEALIFGFLGVLKLRNEVNVLASVTGAVHDHSSGEIYLYKV